MADDDVSLEDLIAIERVAWKLWEQATKVAATKWEALSVLAKRGAAAPGWRSRWPKSVGTPQARILNRQYEELLCCDLFGNQHIW